MQAARIAKLRRITEKALERVQMELTHIHSEIRRMDEARAQLERARAEWGVRIHTDPVVALEARRLELELAELDQARVPLEKERTKLQQQAAELRARARQWSLWLEKAEREAMRRAERKEQSALDELAQHRRLR